MTPRPADDHDPVIEDVDAAAVDAMIEQVLARAPRPIDWARLSAEHAAQVWLDLDEWVRWLVTRYALDHRDVPPCWYAHGDLVEELTALWTAHRAAYDRTGARDRARRLAPDPRHHPRPPADVGRADRLPARPAPRPRPPRLGRRARPRRLHRRLPQPTSTTTPPPAGSSAPGPGACARAASPK